MSLWTYRRSSAFKRSSDIVLRWSDLTNPRAELARSTDAVVTGVTSSSFRTCRTFGNKSSCPETLVFFLFFLFTFFFFLAGTGARVPAPPPLDPLQRERERERKKSNYSSSHSSRQGRVGVEAVRGYPAFVCRRD